MNPYTYHRRGKSLPEAVQPTSSFGSFVKSVFTSSVTPALAFAVVMLGAGSVMAITALAAPELSTDNSDVPVAHHLSLASKSQVLGESIINTALVIDDSALEAIDPSGEVSAKPTGFDSTLGRWNYTITYTVSNLTGHATVTIGSHVVQANITASGTVQTGAILKPGVAYNVSLWSQDSSGAKEKLAQFKIKTPKQKVEQKKLMKMELCKNTETSTTTSPTTTNSNSTSAICVKNGDGEMHCTKPELCAPIMKFNNESERKDATTTDKTPIVPRR